MTRAARYILAAAINLANAVGVVCPTEIARTLYKKHYRGASDRVPSPRTIRLVLESLGVVLQVTPKPGTNGGPVLLRIDEDRCREIIAKEHRR